jgi:hypothetical protein
MGFMKKGGRVKPKMKMKKKNMSIRDKFIALAKAGGKRRDFFKLAKSEGLTDKETLAKKTKNNPKTKAFAVASKLNMPGEEKQKYLQI